MSRAILIALLVALPLGAADVPLSDRPLAPIPEVKYIEAAASPDAVLVGLSTYWEGYVQRIGRDGIPLDASVTFIGSGPILRMVWDGDRWAVLWEDSSSIPRLQVTYVAPSGGVQETLAIDHLFNSFAASPFVLIGNRVLFTSEKRGSENATELLELTPSGTLLHRFAAPRSQSQSARSWPVGLTEGPGILSTLLLTPSSDRLVSIEDPSGTKAELTLRAALSIDFLPSREGGGLLVWDDGGWRGAIVRPDATFSAPFSIGPGSGPEELPRPLLRATARDRGWEALLEANGETYLASISKRGTVAVALVSSRMPWQIVSVAGVHILLHPGHGGGFRFQRVVGGFLQDPIQAGFGGAAQFDVRTAAGASMELAVWEEHSADGPVLKATRIRAGSPLDGAGLMIAESRSSGTYFASDDPRTGFDVAFDGKGFVVVWIECEVAEASSQRNCAVRTRTILADGSLSQPIELAQRQELEGVTIASVGGGRSVVAWFGLLDHVELLPLDRGRRGPVVKTGLFGELPLLAATRGRYLAVTNTYDFAGMPGDLRHSGGHGQLFAVDGTPLTERRQFARAGQPIFDVESDGANFYAVTGDELVTFDREFAASTRRKIARGGEIVLAGRELLVDHGCFERRTPGCDGLPFSGPIMRGAYSLAGDLLRLEPLPVRSGEMRAGILWNDRILVRVPSHPDRLYVRSPQDYVAPAADLAVEVLGVHIVRTAPPAYEESFARFRVEHRGGATVTRLHLWSEDSLSITAAVDGGERRGLPLVLEREFREGDSFEVDVIYGMSVFAPIDPPPLWVGGDAVDRFPFNNGARFVQPLRTRSRPVERP